MLDLINYIIACILPVTIVYMYIIHYDYITAEEYNYTPVHTSKYQYRFLGFYIYLNFDKHSTVDTWQHQVYKQHLVSHYHKVFPILSYVITFLMPIHFLLNNLT